MRSRRNRWLVWSAALCWMSAWPLHGSMALAQALGGFVVVCTEGGARLEHTGERPQAPQTGGAPSCPVCAQLLGTSAAPGHDEPDPVLLVATFERARPWRAAPAYRPEPRASDLARAPPAV